jgi:hypothetical protein
MSFEIDDVGDGAPFDTDDTSDEEAPSIESSGTTREISVDEDRVVQGLGQLVLALVNLLHELLEKQAIRRMESGQLSEDEIERLGRTLMEQAREIERLCDEFELEKDDLNLDLGPLGEMV